MKTLPILAFLTTLVGVFVFPLSFELAGSLVFAAGLGCILLGDYSRTVRPLLATAAVAVPAKLASDLRLAA